MYKRQDQDSDGEDSIDYGGVDCDDENALVNTSASDANLDGIDNNCDGQIDEGAQAGDLDGDGVDVFNGDCNDDDPSVYPGAIEIWYDGIDSDCAGDNDFDQDGDGEETSDYGGFDCDDTDASVNSSAIEVYYLSLIHI